MIVDDNKEFLEELQEILYMAGYEIITSNDSTRVLSLASKTKPDLLLLDLKMNGKSGFDVAKELRQSPSTAGIRIVAMSGYFPIEQESALLERKFINASLKKPFTIADLITRIEETLEARKGGEARWQ